MRRGWLIAVAIVGVLAYGAYLLIPYDYGSRGSPKFAAKWKAILEKFNDPDSAQREFPEVKVKRFDDGDWVFGVSRCSHGYRDGGTVVLKDSSGQVRAFFGHVCGPQFLTANPMLTSNSLAEFYKHQVWETFDFREHLFAE